MSEAAAKPYLIRALYEWCGDAGYTPYLAVKVDEQTKVPTAYVKNGEIVLNLSANATHKLTMDNNWIQFNARFGGISHEIAVPMTAVTGIFAKETGYGLAFKSGQPGDPPGASPSTPTDGGNAKSENKTRPKLQIVK
ncbi:MAG: ClpXP protease specificity-enhancing factor [Betaproteobacteria bacterium]